MIDGGMQLNDSGRLVQAIWEALPSHYFGVDCDAFIIMPNHVHGIIVVIDREIVGAGLKPAPTDNYRCHGLPEIVRGFKTFSSRGINELRQSPGVPVWQRNYYEHVIRNQDELHCIREYIVNNPMKWEFDRENPDVARRRGF